MADKDSILEKHFPTPDGHEDVHAIKDAMDEYMKATCLELLEYIAKNGIELDIVNGKVECYFKNGEGISKEQLFENFL